MGTVVFNLIEFNARVNVKINVNRILLQKRPSWILDLAYFYHSEVLQSGHAPCKI